MQCGCMYTNSRHVHSHAEWNGEERAPGITAVGVVVAIDGGGGGGGY